MKNKLQGMGMFFLLIITIQSFSQVAVVDYMKVKPGNAPDYLTVEKAWKKIHQARLEAGLIQRWSLFQVMFSGANDPYQYATVTLYNSLDDYEKGFDQSIIGKSYPDYKSADWDDFFERTNKSRSLVETKLFYYVTGLPASALSKDTYLSISTMKIKPTGAEAYVQMEKDWYLPLHKEMMAQGAMESWSIWSKWLGDATDFQYIAVNGYSSLGQMNLGNYEETIKKVLPGKKPADIWAQTLAIRDVTATQIWKRIDFVSK